MKSILRLLALAGLTGAALGLTMPLAAQDSMMSLSAESCEYGGEFQSVEAVDEYTVRFTLCFPDPGLPAKIALSTYAIHSAEALNALTDDASWQAFIENPPTTGPYRLERWDRGNEMVFAANENYWGEAPIEATAILRWNSEATARWNELQAGTIDGFDNAGPADFAAIQANPDYQLIPRSLNNIFYLGINNTVAPFNSQKVRQALAYGIDKQRIVDNFYPVGSSIAAQFMPPTIFGFTPDSNTIPFDPDMARQLLEEAAAEEGFTLPLETTLSYRDVVRVYLPQVNQVAQDIQAQLAAIGINVELNLMESGAFLDAATAGQLSLHLLGWGADYPDATNFLDFHFGAGSSPQFGDKDPELTAILTQAGQLGDLDQRLELYTQANNEIADFVPMVPVAHGTSATAWAARIGGAYSGLFAGEQFRVMEDPSDDNIIFMQGAEPISLFCNDEEDGETFRACEQITDSLLSYELGGGAVEPGLATAWTPNEDATEWTFTLREGVVYTDGTPFNAEDVVTTWIMMWDASSPLHRGRTGSFTYFSALFGAFLNSPE
jgi:peptide/nickel transport system substrate-binding protein